MRKLTVLLFVLTLVFTSCKENNVKEKIEKTENPKNIILLIGDGMGVTQIYAAMSVSEKPLSLERFKDELCRSSLM